MVLYIVMERAVGLFLSQIQTIYFQTRKFKFPQLIYGYTRAIGSENMQCDNNRKYKNQMNHFK